MKITQSVPVWYHIMQWLSSYSDTLVAFVTYLLTLGDKSGFKAPKLSVTSLLVPSSERIGTKVTLDHRRRSWEGQEIDPSHFFSG